MKIGVIGGGAAGFYAAIQAKEGNDMAHVILFEKSSKLLSKVRISGGGRCNVTNGSEDIEALAAAYPRGQRLMKRALWQFSTVHIKAWFEDHGVKLYTQDDGRVFPVSDDSRSIIDALLKAADALSIEIRTSSAIEKIEKNDGFILSGSKVNEKVDKVIVASGGSPKIEGLQWLKHLGHKIEPPVPSLFTFNMPDENVTSLPGVSVQKADVTIVGSKWSANGPLLITHWGMSGPAILKLSAFAARDLAQGHYRFKLKVNWTGGFNQLEVKSQLLALISSDQAKTLSALKVFDLPKRLWSYLLDKTGLEERKPCAELGQKSINRLVEVLTNDQYEVNGKTTFKEEFVTCGGVSLKSIDWKTMESKVVPGMYFAGEVLDIDGVTGGYNFQAAWTTGYIAGRSCAFTDK